MALVTDLIIKYSQSFNHIPLPTTLSTTITTTTSSTTSLRIDTLPLLKMVYANLGIDGNTGQVIGSTGNYGIRYDTYASYVLFHFLGHNDIPILPGTWAWALYTILNVRGQPTVPIAYATLVKAAYIGYKKGLSKECFQVIKEVLFKPSAIVHSLTTTEVVAEVLDPSSGAAEGVHIAAQQVRYWHYMLLCYV